MKAVKVGRHFLTAWSFIEFHPLTEDGKVKLTVTVRFWWDPSEEGIWKGTVC